MNRLVMAALTLALTGCAQPASPVADQMQAQIDLKSEINALRAQLMQASGRIAVLEGKLQQARAEIDPASSTGYSEMGTDIGPLLITLNKIEPIADGSRVTLMVGNPHAVTLHGLKLNVKYGPRWDEKQDYFAWEESLREHESSVANSIYSGAWTNVTFSLPGIKPDQLGALSIAGDIDQLSLRFAP